VTTKAPLRDRPFGLDDKIQRPISTASASSKRKNVPSIESLGRGFLMLIRILLNNVTDIPCYQEMLR